MATEAPADQTILVAGLRAQLRSLEQRSVDTQAALEGRISELQSAAASKEGDSEARQLREKVTDDGGPPSVRGWFALTTCVALCGCWLLSGHVQVADVESELAAAVQASQQATSQTTSLKQQLADWQTKAQEVEGVHSITKCWPYPKLPRQSAAKHHKAELDVRALRKQHAQALQLAREVQDQHRHHAP